MAYFTDDEITQIKKVIDQIIKDAVCKVIERKCETNSLLSEEGSEDTAGHSRKLNMNQIDVSYMYHSYFPDKGILLSEDFDFEPLNEGILLGEDTIFMPYATNNVEVYGETWREDFERHNMVTESLKEIEEPESDVSLAPFSINWCYGKNNQIPLKYVKTDEIFYSSSHIGVLLNFEKNYMKFLTGLRGDISCSSFFVKYLAVADSGPEDCGIILWDLEDYKAKRWFEMPTGGTCLLQISPCLSHLVAVTNSQNPTIMRFEIDAPTVISETLPHGKPIDLVYNSYDTDQIIITYSTKLIMAFVRNNVLQIEEAVAPKVSRKIGNYTGSAFTNDGILTGTSLGHVIVRANNGKFVKSMRLVHAGITWLQLIADVVTIACTDGTVWTYGEDLRLRAWYSLATSSINSISLLYKPDSGIPNLSFSTEKSIGIVVDGIKKYLAFSDSSCIWAIDCSPSRPTFVTGNQAGVVVSYHLESRQIQIQKNIVDSGIRVLKFNPSGDLLGLGSENGDLMLLEPILLTTLTVLPTARAAIQYLIFTDDGNTLAYIHQAFGTATYKLTVGWNARGKLRTHSKTITAVTLTGYRLFTIAEDRMLTEFDVEFMLRLVFRIRIELSAVPTSLAWYQGQLLVGNSEMKIRFFDVAKKEVVRTVRSPGETATHILKVVGGCLLFAAGKEIGACPLPWQGWGPCVLAHPRNIKNLCPFNEGVLTTGANDSSVLHWNLNHILPSIEQPLFSDFHNKQIKRIFEAGAKKLSTLIDNFRYFGYFPTNFEISNIKREITSDFISEGTFREILWNYGPPPGISLAEIRDALLSVSDVVRVSGPMVLTERLLTGLEKNGSEGLTREEALECLKVLCAPGLVPPQATLEHFISDILGIDRDIIED